MTALMDNALWVYMGVANKARQPLDHFSHFASKRWAPNEPKSLARLVWGTAVEIEQELLVLLQECNWEDEFDSCTLDLRPQLITFTFKLVLMYATEYDRRILKKLGSYPLKLLLLAKTPAHDPCPERAALCQELLEYPEANLHITALKVLTIFHGEISACADNSGRISTAVYAPFRLLAVSWQGDVQEIEGINNMIQMVCTRSPHIKLPLVDARVANRKSVVSSIYGKRISDVKWSVMQPVVDCILDDACDHIHAVNDVFMCDPNRFTPPLPAEGISAASMRDIGTGVYM